MLGIDHRAQLGKISAPTMILRGENDFLFRREVQERLAEAIPDASLRVYPETCHSPNWERPEWVVRDLEAFMKGERST